MESVDFDQTGLSILAVFCNVQRTEGNRDIRTCVEDTVRRTVRVGLSNRQACRLAAEQAEGAEVGIALEICLSLSNSLQTYTDDKSSPQPRTTSISSVE